MKLTYTTHYDGIAYHMKKNYLINFSGNAIDKSVI